MGDAISSFWQEPDKTTASQPLITLSEVRKRRWEYVPDMSLPPASSLSRSRNRLPYAGTQPCNSAPATQAASIELLETHVEAAERDASNQNATGRQWKPPKKPRRWFVAASWHQWAIAFFLSFAILITCSWLYFGGYNSGNPTGIAGIKDESSLGKPNLEFSVNTYEEKGLIFQVILANLTQLAISCTYLQFNSLFTTMLLTHEQSGYAKQRKGLRVSVKHGEQRSTYCRFQLERRVFCTACRRS